MEITLDSQVMIHFSLETETRMMGAPLFTFENIDNTGANTVQAKAR